MIGLVANEEIESFKARGKHVKKSYSAFVTKLSNLLIEAAEHLASVRDYLQAVAGWPDYEATRLDEENKKENTKLGDRHGEKISIEDNILYPLPRSLTLIEANWRNSRGKT